MRSAVISSINFLINRYLLRMSRVLSPPTFLTDSFNTTTVLSTNVNQRKKNHVTTVSVPSNRHLGNRVKSRWRSISMTLKTMFLEVLTVEVCQLLKNWHQLLTIDNVQLYRETDENTVNVRMVCRFVSTYMLQIMLMIF